jgi:hypothetical protein
MLIEYKCMDSYYIQEGALLFFIFLGNFEASIYLCSLKSNK